MFTRQQCWYNEGRWIQVVCVRNWGYYPWCKWLHSNLNFFIQLKVLSCVYTWSLYLAHFGIALLFNSFGKILCGRLGPNFYILQHPSVSECSVLGLPDNTYGEVVSAVIVPDAEVKRKCEEKGVPALSLEELSTWAKEKLAPYKVLVLHISSSSWNFDFWTFGWTLLFWWFHRVCQILTWIVVLNEKFW